MVKTAIVSRVFFYCLCIGLFIAVIHVFIDESNSIQLESDKRDYCNSLTTCEYYKCHSERVTHGTETKRDYLLQYNNCLLEEIQNG
jgi:hypothetical protein